MVPLIGPDGSCESLLSYARDVTERKREEERRLEVERKMQETQRLESLGLLAGGVAHDFNNLLTAILGMTSVAQRPLPPSHQIQEVLSKIVASCERAAGLCTQMLAYAQRQRVEAELTHVAKLVEMTADLVRASVSKNASIRLRLEAGAAEVEADPTQIQQVLLNLMLNAVEAMPGQQGAVEVHTFCVEGAGIDFRGAAIAPPDATQAFVAIRVSDTGMGMDGTTLARIFEPFFTTKFEGRGLGLPATLGIVRAHGGGLTVRSEPGKGSVFTLYLARAPQAESPAPPPAEPAPQATRVLVVDDEPHVREAIALMLAGAGYEVTLASSGPEALAILEREPLAHQLVLLDLTMPGLGGLETLTELRKRDRRLPVALMSGYTQRDVRGRAAADPALDFMQKPFRPRELFEVLQSLYQRAWAPR